MTSSLSLQPEESHDNTGKNDIKKRFLFSALSASALLAVALCGVHLNSNKSNSSFPTQEQHQRRTVAYSEISKPLPDPDELPVSDEVKEQLAAKYGRWKFWDGEEENRPDDSKMCNGVPNCDVAGDDFPEDGWQGDAVFVNHILNDADALITRAMEAIFEEYGHPKPKSAEALAERMHMFHWDKLDLKTVDKAPPAFQKHGNRGNGGWTTRRSFEGTGATSSSRHDGEWIVHGRRCRAFRFCWTWSYIMQMHKVMAPIFGRLGIKLITRNISSGGLGTVQGAMGSADIYGKDVDLLIWDSGMTERIAEHIDLFFRQGLIGGDKVPVIWSAGGNFPLLKMLHEEADVDVGEFGIGLDGVILTESEEQAKTLPYAVQYLMCDQEHAAVCKEHDTFCAKCWIPREDGVKPEAEQSEKFPSQVSWHPGWRQHQLTGRVIAFSILEALQLAVQQFSDGTMGGPPLADESWHVHDYYENIRNKVKSLDPSLGSCYTIKDKLPERLCKVPMKARTMYTPRANYEESSIVSILKPASDGYIPKNEKKALYEGLDAHNDCFDIPAGEVDVLAIVSGRRRLLEESSLNLSTATVSEAMQSSHVESQFQLKQQPTAEEQDHRGLGEIVPGKGWEIVDEPQGLCDGTYNAVCDRWTHSNCVLGGHHDARAALVGNALSGWLVMTLKGFKEGIIVIKVHTWQKNEDNTITKDWSTENNARQRMLEYEDDSESLTEERQLKEDPIQALPDTFQFEYAINGKITTLSKAEFIEKRQQIQRVVETFTLLDDASFTDKEADVELAIRLQGCGKECTIGLSHVYWA